MLPTFCRLSAMGADVRIDGDEKVIGFDGLTLRTPLRSKAEAVFFREVFVDDVYELRDRRFDGKVVVDVGGFVGESAIAYARRGAVVHVFEPSRVNARLCEKNVLANGLASKVTVHAVGLACERGERQEGRDRKCFVSALGYVKANLPRAIDVLKMDCEGCEYHLFSTPDFLEHLRPKEIYLEYHEGPKQIPEMLRRLGYTVSLLAGGKVGYLTARHDWRSGNASVMHDAGSERIAATA